jgi:two-component system alkaline phosphatase synthesis response regulator PhoP
MARVLVCDDDPGILELLELTVSLEHEVRTASNGRELLAELDRDPAVDLIVCDVMMPELDGFETLARIRARSEVADVPVVMLSARVSDRDQTRAFAAGADAYVTKPFDPEELDRTISGLLSSAAADRGA